jgi:hypothetical protein
MSLHEPPEGCTRWTPGRKAWVVVEIEAGRLTTSDVAARWDVGADEVIRWRERYAQEGLRGLMETVRPPPADDDAVTIQRIPPSEGYYGPNGLEGWVTREQLEAHFPPGDDDNPEWTAEDFANAKPPHEVLPAGVLSNFKQPTGPVYLFGETTVETGTLQPDENGYLQPVADVRREQFETLLGIGHALAGFASQVAPDVHAAPYSLTTAQVRPLTAGELAELVALDCDIPPLPSKLFVARAGGSIHVGDVITFASVPRPSLWRRLLVWLGLRKHRAPPAFVVTSFEPPPQPYGEMRAEQEALRREQEEEAERRREEAGYGPRMMNPGD